MKGQAKQGVDKGQKAAEATVSAHGDDGPRPSTPTTKGGDVREQGDDDDDDDDSVNDNGGGGGPDPSADLSEAVAAGTVAGRQETRPRLSGSPSRNSPSRAQSSRIHGHSESRKRSVADAQRSPPGGRQSQAVKTAKTSSESTPSSHHSPRSASNTASNAGRRPSSPRQAANGRQKSPVSGGQAGRRGSADSMGGTDLDRSPTSPRSTARHSPSRSLKSQAAVGVDMEAHRLSGDLANDSSGHEAAENLSSSSSASSSSDMAETSSRGAAAGMPGTQPSTSQTGRSFEEENDEEASCEVSATSNNAPLSLSATVSRGAYHQCGTARRVKVYELKGETWFDRGTGYCAGVYDEQNDAALLVARMEETCRRLTLGGDENQSGTAAGIRSEHEEEQVGTEGREDREHYVLVVSENLDTDDLLLKARVVKDDVYQRQQDTLVVWTEPDGTDMALSFQEADGCHEVWEFLTEVQKHFLLSARSEGLEMEDGEGMASGMLGMSAAGMTTENDLVMSDGSPFALPLPRMNNLHVIEITLKDAASRSPQAREKVAEWILREDYVAKLIPVFQDAEELEQLETLHRLCTVMHTIIMLNDNVLVERMLRDDAFLGVVGMLEYDPEFPRLKASYRDYLMNTARFRQVVPIPDDIILAKIHQTFRLQYLKDVILARTLDDSTFAVLNSLIFYHQADIVVFCSTSEPFLSSLFQLFEPDRSESDEKKAEAIVFLQQLCAVGKQVQLPSRLALYRTLTEWGLLIVLEYALSRSESRLRNAAAEILMSIIEYDASGVRIHILDQVDKGSAPLLTKLASILHEIDGDLGLKTQITESLRILFDSGPDGASGGPVVAQTLAAAAAQSADDGQRKDETDRFLNWFYDGEVDHLFAPLKTLKKYRDPYADGDVDRIHPPLVVASAARSSLLNHLCELLTFVMVHHHFRSQYWVISSEIGVRVASLLFAREKHLRLAALRFFRACLAKGNQFINRHFVKIGLLSAILSVIEAESARDNLVTSACLEFFEHIRKEPIKPLISHLMEKYEARVRTLTRHSAIGHYFQAMILQWEKNNEVSATHVDPDGSLASFEAERERRARDMARRGGNRAIMDSDEENYFQEDDEEEEGDDAGATDDAGQEAAASLPPYNAGRPRSGSGLVPYAGEEEDAEVSATGGQSREREEYQDDVGPTMLQSGLSKRKKGEDADEDEDDDMMGRLAKRKSLISDEHHTSTPSLSSPGQEARSNASDQSGKRLSINLPASDTLGSITR